MKSIFLYKLFRELARRSNNGELFNKNKSPDEKDTQTVFFWSLATKFNSDYEETKKLK